MITREQREAADHFMQNSDPFGEWRPALEAWRQAREASMRALDEFESAQAVYLEALRNV